MSGLYHAGTVFGCAVSAGTRCWSWTAPRPCTAPITRAGASWRRGRCTWRGSCGCCCAWRTRWARASSSRALRRAAFSWEASRVCTRAFCRSVAACILLWEPWQSGCGQQKCMCLFFPFPPALFRLWKIRAFGCVVFLGTVWRGGRDHQPSGSAGGRSCHVCCGSQKTHWRKYHRPRFHHEVREPLVTFPWPCFGRC